jgi:GDP-4-dehydro-6-deoxy-D-mannose reductase
LSKKLKRKVIVVGGNGFIGQALLSELHCNHSDNLDIVSLVRRVSGNEAVKEILVQESSDIRDAITSFSPQVVFDLSGSYVAENYFEFQTKNLVVPLVVLDALKDLKSDARYIVASSAAIYNLDRDNERVNEHSDVEPSSFYGAAKASLENACSIYARKYGLNITVGRIFNVMGPSQPKMLFPSVAIQGLVEVKKGKLSLEDLNHSHFAGLNFLRDFLDVRDVAAALCCLLSESTQGLTTYNICSGNGVKLNDLYLEAYDEILGDCSFHVSSTNQVEGFSIYGDNRKFCDAFDWTPVVSVWSSLKDQINKVMTTQG